MHSRVGASGGEAPPRCLAHGQHAMHAKVRARTLPISLGILYLRRCSGQARLGGLACNAVLCCEQAASPWEQWRGLAAAVTTTTPTCL
jgi:hypothetical protein